MTKHIYGDYSGDFSEFEGESDFTIHGDYVQGNSSQRNRQKRQAKQHQVEGAFSFETDSGNTVNFEEGGTYNENSVTFNIGGRVIRGDKVEGREPKQDPFAW